MDPVTKKVPTGFIAIKRKTKKAKNPVYITMNSQELPEPMTERLSHIYIPPAYNNLLVSKSASNKIQVIGEDIAGRKQYIYNEKHKSGLEKRKYAKIAGFAPKIHAIERDNTEALKRLVKLDPLNWTKQELISIVLYMLVSYHFRIGCTKYAELYKSYGITTLKPIHFKKIGNTYHIEFIGKKGMKNKTDEKMPLIIRLINKLLVRAKIYRFTHVFNYRYINPISGHEDVSLISSVDITDFLKTKYKITATPKMFRTYYANYHMIEFIKDFITTEEYKNIVDAGSSVNVDQKIGKILKREIGDYVSNKLNNTQSICKKNYLNNILFEKITTRPTKYIDKVRQSTNIHKLVIELLND